MQLSDAAIFDIDGTLAHVDDYLHFIHNIPKNWDAFHEACSHADVKEDMVAILHLHKRMSQRIIFMTARSEKYRPMTFDWLVNNDLFDFQKDSLIMRKENDRRDAVLVKKDATESLISVGIKPLIGYDNREDICQMWQDMGIKAYHVRDNR